MSKSKTFFSVAASSAVLEDATAGITLKVQCRDCEINVWVPVPDLPLLRRVPFTPWKSGALRIGTSAGAAAFWSCDAAKVTILVGRDDESWDFAVLFAEDCFPRLVAEVERELGHAL